MSRPSRAWAEKRPRAKAASERRNRSWSPARGAQFNHYTLDGIENTDPELQPLRAAAVDRFLTGVQGRDRRLFGRVRARRGADQCGDQGRYQYSHGAVFEFLRNDKFDAKDYKQVGRQESVLAQPVRICPGRKADQATSCSSIPISRRCGKRRRCRGWPTWPRTACARAIFPLPAARFSTRSTRVFSTDAQGNMKAVSALPFPNNVIPASRFNPVSLKLLEFYPKATSTRAITFWEISPGSGRARSPGSSSTSAWIFWRTRSPPGIGRLSWGDDDYKEIADFQDQEANILTKTWQTLLSQHPHALVRRW